MLIEYIERLRKEPKEVRQRAVITLTIIIVAIIAVLYIAFRIYEVADPKPRDARTLAAPYESGQ